MAKILLVNTSAQENGVLEQAMEKCVSFLEQEGMEGTIVKTEGKIVPCTACGKCMKSRKCVFADPVNQIAGAMKNYDALIIGSDVFYGEADEQTICFLQRLFRSSSEKMAEKPASVILHARSGKGDQAFNEIASWFHYADMPVITSFNCYTVHHNEDENGMESMHKLASQMAWLLKCMEAGKEKGITPVCDIPDKISDFTR